MYVDDLLTGADSTEEAVQLIRESTTIMAAAGMELTKWSSNNIDVASTALKEFDPRSDLSKALKSLD